MLQVPRFRWTRSGLVALSLSVVLAMPGIVVKHAAAAMPHASVTLTFDIDDDPTEFHNTQLLVKAFERLNPGITLKMQKVPGDYVQKEFVKAAAGTLPDIMYSADVFSLPFGYHHIIADMQPLIDADPSFDASDIYPVMLNLGRIPGSKGLYLMPQEADALLMFYNKTLFKAAGVPYPTGNWTYAQFLDAARKLTKTDSSGKTVQWGVSLGYNFWAQYVPFMVGFGGGILTPDGKHASFSSPGSIAGIQAMADLYRKYKVAVPPTVNFGTDPFVLGKVAMSLTNARPGVPSLRAAIGKKFDWDAQVWPVWPSGKHVNGMGTQGFAVSSSTLHKKEAWAFVRFVGSRQGQAIFAHSYSSIPIRASQANDPVWRKLPGPPYNNDAFIKAISYGITPPVFPVAASLNCGTVYTGQVNTFISNALDKIVLTGAAVGPTLKNLDKEINTCIDNVANNQ